MNILFLRAFVFLVYLFEALILSGSGGVLCRKPLAFGIGVVVGIVSNKPCVYLQNGVQSLIIQLVT